VCKQHRRLFDRQRLLVERLGDHVAQARHVDQARTACQLFEMGVVDKILGMLAELRR